MSGDFASSSSVTFVRKLDIGAAPDYHRRVVAVLTFLRAPGVS